VDLIRRESNQETGFDNTGLKMAAKHLIHQVRRTPGDWGPEQQGHTYSRLKSFERERQARQQLIGADA